MEDYKRIDNMMNWNGKSCSNCRFASGAPGDDIITCGVHVDNFTAESFCSHWMKRKVNELHCPACQGEGCPFCKGNLQE